MQPSNLKVGDKVRWKVDDENLLGFRAGQRSEVTSIVMDFNGERHFTFKRLDPPPAGVFDFIGDIVPEALFDRISD